MDWLSRRCTNNNYSCGIFIFHFLKIVFMDLPPLTIL
jgi:hypothetical protein